ncbi:Fe-S protein assembly co-chaperone HscB [Rhodoferax sp.]|uniref:Fe-S protein assembly co-chaperone HscB n=1 Tax=Rhodoferax sp. TaxID=50421 RepID=UPI00374D29BD
MNLQSNDFELFGLAPQFAQDRAAIDARWKDLQREAHPDKFAAQGAAAQRVALQWSVRINEAYRRLKDPLKRAAYLCELHGAAVNAENNTAMPPEFLMQQMDWREALDDANSLSDMDDLSLQVKLAMRDELLKCEQFLDQQHDYLQAVQQVRTLMFIERFDHDVHARLDQMSMPAQGQQRLI